MTKPLGQVALEAWREYWKAKPSKLSEQDRQAWQAAAEAVVEAHISDFRDVLAKQDAVIEAAVALVRGYNHDTAEWAPGTVVALDEAVEALQEVEGE